MRTKRNRLWIVLGVVVALIMGLAGCSGSHHAPSNGNTSTAAPAASTFASIGANVGAPKADKPAGMHAAIDTTAKQPFASALKALGPVVQITPGGKLAHQTTLQFKLSSKVASASDVLIATSETGAAGSWTLVPATSISADGMYAYVVTSKLSIWQPLLRDAKAVLNTLEGIVRDSVNALSGDVTTTTARPNCPNDAQATSAGYKVISTGNAVHWCLDMVGGKAVVKVVNNRRYPLAITHPSLAAKNVASTKLEIDELAHLGSGDSTVVFPFDEADFTAPANANGTTTITTSYSGTAQGLYQLQFGIEAAINLLTRFGAGGGTIANGKITVQTFDKIAEYMDKALSVAGCANALHSSIDPGSILSGCFSPADLLDIFGWKAVILAATMVAGPFVEFFKSEFNGVGDLLDGRTHELITLSHNASTTLSYGGLNLQVPSGWHKGTVELLIDGMGIRTGSTCAKPTAFADNVTYCQGFNVEGEIYYASENAVGPDGYPRLEFDPNSPNRYGQDTTNPCPITPGPGMFRVNSGQLLASANITIGGKPAVYREWKLGCAVGTSASNSVNVPATAYYTQRDWFIPSKHVLVVDEWNTPNLAAILANATWN